MIPTNNISGQQQQQQNNNDTVYAGSQLQRKSAQQICRQLEQKVREAQNPPQPATRKCAPLPPGTWTTALRSAQASIRRTHSAPNNSFYAGSNKIALDKRSQYIVNSQFHDAGLGLGTREPKYPDTPGALSLNHVGSVAVLDVLASNREPVAKYVAAPAWKVGEKRGSSLGQPVTLTPGPGFYNTDDSNITFKGSRRRTMRMPSSWCSIP